MPTENFYEPNTWVCPEGVTWVVVTAIGACGGGQAGRRHEVAPIIVQNGINGGEGGTSIEGVEVTPNTEYEVIVGEGGEGGEGCSGESGMLGGYSSACGVVANGGWGGGPGNSIFSGMGGMGSTSYGENYAGGAGGTTYDIDTGLANGWAGNPGFVSISWGSSSSSSSSSGN